MNLTKPLQNSIEDKIIDHAFRHVAGYSVLKTFLETKNWSYAFGMGGYGGGDYRWQGDKNGIKYSVGNDRSEIQISVSKIMDRANKWINAHAPGEQLKLF